MQEQDNLIRFDEVERISGLKRSAIYKYIKRGTFPKPVPVTAKAVGWLESEVRAWQRARVAERDAKLVTA